MSEEKKHESAIDEMVAPYADRLASTLVGYVTDVPAVRRAILKLDPRVIAGIHHVLPGVGGLLIGKLLPNSIFRNEQGAAIVKNFLLHVVKKVADSFEAGEDIESEDFADRLEDDMRRLMVKVDPLGQCHDPDCSRLAMAKFSRNQVKDIPILAAVDQALPMAPCCMASLEKKVQAPAKSAAPKRRPRSALDVIGMLDDEQRAEFDEWLQALEPDDLRSAMAGLSELDSVEEAVGFLSLDPELRLEMLPLLENRSLSSSVKEGLRFLGDSAKTGFNGASQALNGAWQYATTKVGALDARLQPTADSLENFATAYAQPAPPPAPVGRWRRAGRAIKSAAWFLVGTIVPVGRRDNA